MIEINPFMYCTFCFQSSIDPKPYCTDNPGNGCTYGFHHDFPGQTIPGQEPKIKPKQVKAPDKQVCLKCGLHLRHPTSASNGCEHQYP